MSEAITDLPPDFTTVAWKQALGRAGPYEKAVNDGSLAFQRLLSRLRRAGGSFDSDSYHVWTFGGQTIARRPRRHE